MSTSKDRRGLRRLVRVGFAHFRLLLLVIGICALLALVPSAFQPRTFVGFVELAMAREPGSSPTRLPDLLKIRRLALSSKNIARLAAPEGAEPVPSVVSNVMRSVKIEPITGVEADRSVVRLEVEIPAGNHAAAEQRLRAYVEQMQHEFESEKDPSLASWEPSSSVRQWEFDVKPADWARSTKGRLAVAMANSPVRLPFSNRSIQRFDSSVMPVSYQEKAKQKEEKPAVDAKPEKKAETTPSPEAGRKEDATKSQDRKLDDAAKSESAIQKDLDEIAALENMESKLAERASALKSSLVGLNSAVESARRSLAERAQKLDLLESGLNNRLALVNDLETRRMTSLPADIESRFPAIAQLSRRLDALRRQQQELASVVRPNHPDWKSLEKELNEVQTRLTTEIEQVARIERSTIRRLEQERKTLEGKRNEDQARLDQLNELIVLRDDLQRQIQMVRDRMQRRQELELASRRHVEPFTGPIRLELVQPLPLPTAKKEPEPAAKSETPPKVDRTPAAIAPGPPGRLLVAGPFVDANPVRPRTLRDALIGSLAGLLLGIMLVFARAGSDQRIYSPQDVDDPDLNVEVLGSVPDLKTREPFQWSAHADAGGWKV